MMYLVGCHVSASASSPVCNYNSYNTQDSQPAPGQHLSCKTFRGFSTVLETVLNIDNVHSLKSDTS